MLTTAKKIEELRPPTEIRSDTKARRAWCAAKAAEVNAQPNRTAKIVGIGSYQAVSVYETVQVAGRIQVRGTCQGCGRVQAVTPGIAKHGYTVESRGEGGFFAGTCHGSGRLPAEQDVSYTQSLITTCRETADAHEAAIPDATTKREMAVKPSVPKPHTVWNGVRYALPRTEAGAAWKWYEGIMERPLWLATEAKHLRMHADDLTRLVLPRLGQPLIEVEVL